MTRSWERGGVLAKYTHVWMGEGDEGGSFYR